MRSKFFCSRWCNKGLSLKYTSMWGVFLCMKDCLTAGTRGPCEVMTIGHHVLCMRWVLSVQTFKRAVAEGTGMQAVQGAVRPLEVEVKISSITKAEVQTGFSLSDTKGWLITSNSMLMRAPDSPVPMKLKHLKIAVRNLLESTIRNLKQLEFHHFSQAHIVRSLQRANNNFSHLSWVLWKLIHYICQVSKHSETEHSLE